MRHVLYMAWRYVAFHRLKSSILVGAIALIVFIPAALRVLVRQGENQLTARLLSYLEPDRIASQVGCKHGPSRQKNREPSEPTFHSCR